MIKKATKLSNVIITNSIIKNSNLEFGIFSKPVGYILPFFCLFQWLHWDCTNPASRRMIAKHKARRKCQYRLQSTYRSIKDLSQMRLYKKCITPVCIGILRLVEFSATKRSRNRWHQSICHLLCFDKALISLLDPSSVDDRLLEAGLRLSTWLVQ